eukprot:c24251_g3_i1 orf=419-1102(+)
MYKDSLQRTVLPYEKHVILCFGNPSNWPSHIETSPSVAFALPRLLAASLKAHKDQMPKQTRFTICKGSDDLEASRGDVLIFPDMVKYKDLDSSDVEGFVEEFLIQEGDWPLRRVEKLNGFHIFVCAHGSRDMRCGVCGPALVDRFEKEVSSRGLDGFVFIRSCSHVGGHKYAGNIIIYGRDASGEIAGHWYGYVTLNDVAVLLDEHIGKGLVVHKLWRGQLGLAEKQ